MFRREINPFSVTDRVRFVNIDKKLTLTVRDEASALVYKIMRANAEVQGLTDASTDAEKEAAARSLAEAFFGAEGAKLCEFYESPIAVIKALGMYFEQRLGPLITKAQKRK